MQPLTVSAHAFTVYYLSEQAVTLEFGHEISEMLHQKVSSFDQLIHSKPFKGFKTTVPAYSTLTVFFDAVQVAQSGLPGEDGFEKVSGYLNQLNNESSNTLNNATTNNLITKPITIPTCYGGAYGEDLQEVAGINKLSVDEVIHLHSSAVYKVYMVGFVPGFAYLGGMPAQIAAPRKAAPRRVIPAGSVGIAGEQTGIYPLETPGGWQLIGRTPLKLFDAAKHQPSLLKAGDQVLFKPIEPHEFNQTAIK